MLTSKTVKANQFPEPNLSYCTWVSFGCSTSHLVNYYRHEKRPSVVRRVGYNAIIKYH